jgi:hypothetical protein
MDAITLVPLGNIHTPFTMLAGMPIQAVAAAGVASWIEIDPASVVHLTVDKAEAAHA